MNKVSNNRNKHVRVHVFVVVAVVVGWGVVDAVDNCTVSPTSLSWMHFALLEALLLVSIFFNCVSPTPHTFYKTCHILKLTIFDIPLKRQTQGQCAGDLAYTLIWVIYQQNPPPPASLNKWIKEYSWSCSCTGQASSNGQEVSYNVDINVFCNTKHTYHKTLVVHMC